MERPFTIRYRLISHAYKTRTFTSYVDAGLPEDAETSSLPFDLTGFVGIEHCDLHRVDNNLWGLPFQCSSRKIRTAEPLPCSKAIINAVLP